MKEYSERAMCPKCGCQAIGVRYQRQSHTGLGVMRRDCGRCGYEWVEAPLDAPVPTNQQEGK